MIPFDIQRGSTVNDPFVWSLRQADEVNRAAAMDRIERTPADAEVKQALAERGIEVSADKPNEKGSGNDHLRHRNGATG